jgi:hypothetical protein
MFLIGKIGPPAADALPLLKRLRDESDNDRYREMIQRAIDSIEVSEEPPAKDDGSPSDD